MKPEPVSEGVQEPNPQHPAEQSVDFLDLVIILAKGRKIIFLSTLAAVILSLTWALTASNSYTAVAVIMPPDQSSSGASLMGQLGLGGGGLASSLGIKSSSQVYISLFHSRTLEDSMVQRFGLMSRYGAKRESMARTAFEGHAKVALGAKDGLITLTVTDSDPQMAAQIANGYIDEYRKLSANLAITEASQRRAFFQQQLLEANENLATAEEAMKGTEQSTGVLELDSAARSLIESAATLRAQVVAKEVQLQGMRSYATEDNPQMLEVKQQLVALQDQLAKLAGSGQYAGSDFVIPKGKVPEAEMEYIRKLRDMKYYETIADLIGKQFEMAKLDEARQGSIIQVVDQAVPPDHWSGPKRTITVVASTLFAFLASCGWCILMTGVQRIKKNPAKIRRLNALRAAFR
jgi:uncharacterized protein involved in exopolysaccharide biosynthesis